MRSMILTVVATVLGTGGCGATVRSSTAAGANLTQYRTFAFYTSPYKERQPETIADQQIRSDIARDLTQRGLAEATGGTPDVLVSFHTVLQQKLDIQDVGYGPWGLGGFPDVTTYTQGTLVIDFIDPRTHNVVWRGTASQVVNHPDNPNLAKLDKAVAKLINQYPAQQAAAPRQAM